MSPWRSPLRRSVTVIVIGALLLAGVAPPALGQDPSADAAAPGTGDGLVKVPVPAEPRTPSAQPPEPAATADAWLAATSDEARRDILLDVLAGIGIGVYTQDGEPILFGTEKEFDDPWLLDFEVALLSADPADLLWTSIADRAAMLQGIVETADGEPLGADAIAGAVEGGLAESLADPAEPMGFPLLLARELVLRESGVDLADGVPTDLLMGSLAATLIAWDLLWPLMSGEPATALLAAAVPAAFADERTGARPRLRVADAPRTAAACDRIASWATSESPSIGRSAAQTVISNIRQAGMPLHLIHAWLISNALRVRGEGPGGEEMHYQHTDESFPGGYAYSVHVTIADDFSDLDGSCAAFLGLRMPPKGPLQGAIVAWDPGILPSHGQVECPPEGCQGQRTGADGSAWLMFEPRTELEPAGLGPEKHDETIVLANVQYLLSLGNVLGTVQVSGAYVYQARKLTWHRQYRLELHIDSTLKGESHQRYTATAKGGADIWDQGTGLLRGDGELEVRTRPGRADGCRGETSYKGSGTYDLEVVFASVDARNQLVLVGIDSGPEEESPDTVTFEGCGPVKRWTGTFNTWENNFMLANQEDLRPGQGILLSGWDWKATDSTWTSGGLVASLTRNEKCPASLCSGKTKYELHAYPIE